MQVPGPLRGPSPCVGNRFLSGRTPCAPGLPVGCRRSCTSRQAVSSPEGESTTSSTAPPANSNVISSDQHNNVIDVDVEAIVPRSKAGDPKPTAATTGFVESDWLEPPPGDWGGTVDAQGIKEPDSSGMLFFFIIIAGISVGVHQLLSYIGARGEEQLARGPRGQVAVIVAPASRAMPLQPASKPGALAEGETSPAPTSVAAPSPPRAAAESAESSAAVVSSTQGDSKASGLAAAEKRPERDETRGSGGPAGPSSMMPGASGGETANDMDNEASEDNATDLPEQFAPQSLQQQRSAGSGPSAPPAVSPLSTPASADGRAAASSGAVKPLQTSNEWAAVQGSGPATDARPHNSAAAPTASSGPPRGLEAAKQDTAMEAEPFALLFSPTPATSSVGADGGFGGLRPGPPAQPEKAGNGRGPSSDMVRSTSPFAGSSGFFMGDGGGEAGGGGGSTAAAAAALAAEPSAPARLSLPAVRPEPLSRAPDSSALACLPNDSSLPSLRERAQLALRAAAAAVEASQRAAAYAAAASSAASRAAEAAERAAAAATLAQAGLESAAESAIVAAEVRVAQAAEAAKDAEGRAASAAAHATAYQDMSQSQADIAERAASVHKPAAPGPLSQLQQLWRSASSAFTQGQQHSQQQGAGTEPSGSGIAHGGGAAESAVRRGGASQATSGGGAGGNVGVAAAETISSTVKGLLSWLGQGDGTR